MSPVVRNAAQLGHLLKSARRAAGLTQAALAATTGLNQSRVSTVERLPGRLTIDELLTLAATLHLELALRPRPADAAATHRDAEW